MTVTLEIPEELARRLGPEAQRMSREALGLEAHRRGLWTEAELGRFLGLTRLALDRFLKDRGVDLAYNCDDLEGERKVHRASQGRYAGRRRHYPFNSLVLIDLVEILPQLYGTVVIPPEVRDELLAADAPSVVRS